MTPESLNINYKKVAVELTPAMLRQAVFLALLKSGISQIAYLQTQLIQFRTSTNYRLFHNGQVCYLRAVLNDQFDPIDRLIEIVDAESKAAGMIPRREFEILVPNRYTPVLIVSARGYGGASGFDFVVRVPNYIYTNPTTMLQLKAVVNIYKLASKQFDVTTL